MNREDTTDTNITLTVREVTGDPPVAAIVKDEDSVDILRLSGATHVLRPQLVNRTLQEGAIGSLTGLVVIAIQDQDRSIAELHSDTWLPKGADLVVIGNIEQRRTFSGAFGRA